MSITGAGSYFAFVYHLETECFETINLWVETAPADTLISESLGLTFCAEESVAFGDLTFGAAGTYFVTDTTLGCAYAYEIKVGELASYAVSLDTSLVQGNTLLYGGSAITTGGSYVFDFQTTAGCDSTVTLNVELISGTEDISLGGEVLVVNPISDLANFRLLAPSGDPLVTEEVHFFDALGRRVGQTTAQPTGVYFFRCRLPNEDRWLSGRVVVYGG